MTNRHAPDWLEQVQTPPKAIPDDANRPPPQAVDTVHQPIRTADAWSERRRTLRQRWRRFLGEIKKPTDPPDFEELDRERVEPNGDSQAPVERSRILFEAEPGRTVEAYLLRPAEPPTTGKRPGAVVLHSTVDHTIRQPAGLEGPEDKWIGLHLARRGYVAICPRCFLWELGGPGRYSDAVDWLRQHHPGVAGTALMTFDAQRALDHLLEQEDVDPRRIAAIGHSLGAKEVLFLAAFDDRVRVTVSSEGGIGIRYSNWDAPWYHGPAARHPGFPLDHAQVLACVAPRAFLLVGGDSADGDRSWPYIDAVLPVWTLTGAPKAIGLFNHKGGHAFPDIAQTSAYEWTDFQLRERSTRRQP